MKHIELSGKYAVGRHQFTIVDDDLFDELNQWRWKAKPNGSGTQIYAIRTVKVGPITRDIRMHREVLGYDGPLDIDHINRDPLDNQRCNLRVVSRSVNIRNTDYKEYRYACIRCGAPSTGLSVGLRKKRNYCSRTCSKGMQRKRRRQRLGPAVPFDRDCEWCSNVYQTFHSRSRFCRETCRKAAKKQRQLIAGALLTCQRCASAVPLGRRRFCSKECSRADYNHRRFVGKAACLQRYCRQPRTPGMNYCPMHRKRKLAGNRAGSHGIAHA